MQKASLNPTTPDQTFEVVGEGPYNFVKVLARSREMQAAGDVREACNERFHAFQRLAELIPEDEEVNLEWNHCNSRAALELIHASAIDHFLINDFELSAALLEMLLELDPRTIWRVANCWLSITWLWTNKSCTRSSTTFRQVSGTRHPVAVVGLPPRRPVAREGSCSTSARACLWFAEFTADEHPGRRQHFLRDIEGEHSFARGAGPRTVASDRESLGSLSGDSSTPCAPPK